jgi:hypothetical protein
MLSGEQARELLDCIDVSTWVGLRDRCAQVPTGLCRRRALRGAAGRHDVILGLAGHGDKPGELAYFAFDLLHLDCEDLTRLPLLERKARLEALLSGPPAVIRFSSHVIIGNGAEVSEEGSKLGVEGMVSKQIDKPYLPGNRGVWVKTKF